MTKTINSLESFIHDIKTPLASIKYGAEGFKVFLPELINAYSIAVSNNLIKETINSEQIDLISKVPSNIEISADLITKQLGNLK